MEIFYIRDTVHKYLFKLRSAGKTIGFVPTMGALHEGHLALVESARLQSDIVVCSIFVNPTQFNDKSDLENYPRPIEEDIKKLEKAGCHILFMPEVDEMYNKSELWHIELGGLDTVLEGKIRPGHYQGVTQIVKKLFDTIKPDYAFFGQKDYQQFMVISYMVRVLHIPVQLIVCPIIREKDGLAMSSRNIRLSPEERIDALALYKALTKASELFKTKTIGQIKNEIDNFLASAKGIEPEYFEIYDAGSFKPVNDKSAGSIIALVAAKVGKTRIIDNMMLKLENNS